jgi:hypothetical protein
VFLQVLGKYLDLKVEKWFVYFLGLLDRLKETAADEILERLSAPPRVRQRVRDARAKYREILYEFYKKPELRPSRIYDLLAPLELETLITRPIEESVGIIRNVRSVRSVSRAGQADVLLEFAWGTDMDLAGIDVREKIDLLQLPLEASRPILLRFDPSTEPVMRYAFVDSDEFAKVSARPAASSASVVAALRR